MKKTFSFISFLFCFFWCLQIAQAQFKVIGYYPMYAGGYPAGVSTLDLAKITHLNVSFANPDAAGNLIPNYGTNANITTVVNACHAQGVQVFVSIAGGGAPGANYSTLLSSPANINNFVTRIVNYTNTLNLDGIDVDIEGNILDGTTITAAQYQDFVTALGTALHANGKVMSCALGSWFGGYVTNAAAAQFDWINMMSYDLCGPWSGACQHSPYSMATGDFAYWNGTKGVPASKLVVGVPFYGYGWGTYDNDGMTYCDIVNTYPGAENFDQIGSGGNGLYYNGIATIQQKTTFAKQNAAGIMIWELTQDCATSDSRSLLRTITTTLPVTWTDVRAAQETNGINIHWNTTEETGNDYFSIEKSTTGIAFQEIGTVKGVGMSSSVSAYNFHDTETSVGDVFYRIKQVDVDGKYSYSPIVSISPELSSSVLFEVNPNPASQQEIKIRFMESGEEQRLELCDVLGKIYYSERVSPNQHTGYVSLPLPSSVRPGIYFLSAIGAKGIYRVKVRIE